MTSTAFASAEQQLALLSQVRQVGQAGIAEIIADENQLPHRGEVGRKREAE
jgi:hypothetical protein